MINWLTKKSVRKVFIFEISAPKRRWSEIPLVALRSGEFPSANATYRIAMVGLVVVLCLLECRVCSANFSALKNGLRS
jgi:hypothetical protein